MCTEICDGAGAGICDGVPSTCSSYVYVFLFLIFFIKADVVGTHLNCLNKSTNNIFAYKDMDPVTNFFFSYNPV